jgi:hypothetical protein
MGSDRSARNANQEEQMFNVVFLVKRRPDLSPEEFAHY